MPRGGARIGAGRKPKNKPDLTVIDGGAAFSGEASSLLTPPASMPDDQRVFWIEYAPLAIGSRTLTPATVPNFKLLCELEAEKQATKATIDRDGRTYIKCVVDGAGNEHQELKAHPLKADYAKLAKDVDRLMARFMLAPFGKPAGPAMKSKVEQQKTAARQQFFGASRG